ncbi:MAG: hypothetical protein HRT77_15445 [Halioglobus sp.]|nr:hypothetical protein [Halioglobus sp.]
MQLWRQPLIRLISFLAFAVPSAVAQVTRDSGQAVLAHNEMANGFGASWERNFCRNMACSCGLSENYTFLVVEPTGKHDR